MRAVLKGHPSLSFQKSRLNDTTWGCQVVITIETSNAHRYRNFEWPQENWGKGERYWKIKYEEQFLPSVSLQCQYCYLTIRQTWQHEPGTMNLATWTWQRPEQIKHELADSQAVQHTHSHQYQKALWSLVSMALHSINQQCLHTDIVFTKSCDYSWEVVFCLEVGAQRKAP